MHNPGDLLWTAVWLIAAALAGAAAIFVARSWRKRYHASELEQPFTLQDLRAMRERGDISAAEFDAMKAAIVGQTMAAAERPRSRTGGPTGRGDHSAATGPWLAGGGDATSGQHKSTDPYDDRPGASHDSDGSTNTDGDTGGDGGDAGGGGNGGGD